MSARDTRRGRGQARARMLTVHGATQRLKAGGLRGFLGLHKLVFLKNIYIYIKTLLPICIHGKVLPPPSWNFRVSRKPEERACRALLPPGR